MSEASELPASGFRKGKLCVLIPAYNCAATIAELSSRVPLPGEHDEIIVLDDCSADSTFEAASRIERVFVERNARNLGYGGTSRRLYEIALERKADFTVNIHGDFGHRPEDITAVMEKLEGGKYDIVIGSRLLYILNEIERRGWKCLLSLDYLAGMPYHRAVGHLVLTWIQNKCAGTEYHCFHEGMRACTREVAEWAVSSELPTWYNYDIELLIRAHRHGFRIGEVPTRPFYDARAGSAAPAFRYGMRSLVRALESYREKR